MVLANNMLTQNLEQIQSDSFPGTSLTNISIGSIIGQILPYVFGIVGSLLLVYLVIGGFQMMFSRGDPKAMQSAQAKITNALIGFVIVILSFTIVQLIGKILGLEGTFFGKVFGGK